MIVLTIFVKHIFNFSQTAAQILMKFGSDMHLSKVTKVCFNQLYDLFSLNYANELLGSYVTYIYYVKLYVTM